MNRNLKIAVDARCLNRNRIRGIGKVLDKIIELSNPCFHWILLGDRPDLELHVPKHPNITSKLQEQRGYRFNAWEQFRLPAMVKAVQPDVLLCPANSAPYKQSTPTVAIVHDAIPWTACGTNEASRGRLRSLLDHQAFKSCRAITTISKSSANDIMQLWPDLQSKLKVIPNGIDRRYLNESHTALSPDLLQRGIREPYFVYCGGVITRKRAAWAIQTFEQAASGDAQLVLCGIEKAELGKLQYKNLPTKKLIIPGFIPEEEMPCLFQRSLGVLYPTLYEGFGLPAIESQASGVACLMSPVSSLKELIGPGAISLPTMNKQAWIQAVNQLYRNNGLPPSDAQAARSWTERYCWKGSVNQYEELFYEIVERHHSSEKTS